MQNQHIEIIGRGLLVDFMKGNAIEPVTDSFDTRYSGSHMVIEKAGHYNGSEDSGDLLSKLTEFLDRHNAYSKVWFCAYRVEQYAPYVYISIAQ